MILLEFSPIDDTVRTTSPWRPQYQLSMRKYALNQCSAISVRLVSISRLNCAGVSANLLFRPDFWGPASNFGIPLAAVMDVQKDPEMWVLLLFYNLGNYLSQISSDPSDPQLITYDTCTPCSDISLPFRTLQLQTTHFPYN